MIHAICEDYRAGATIDLELDEADRGAAPDRVPAARAVGRAGPARGVGDVLAIWRTRGRGDVRGAALPCGHHLPEEAPEETYAALHAFLAPG